MNISLSPTQQDILKHAATHTEGQLLWFPDHLKGGARQKVLDSLAKRDLISTDRKRWFVSATGYEALGIPHRSPLNFQDLDEAVQAAEASWKEETAKPNKREHSKQNQVIALLQRPEGATISQICEATGWQPHTVRGAFAGTFKKKLGLVIVSHKSSTGDRVYRINQPSTSV